MARKGTSRPTALNHVALREEVEAEVEGNRRPRAFSDHFLTGLRISMIPSGSRRLSAWRQSVHLLPMSNQHILVADHHLHLAVIHEVLMIALESCAFLVVKELGEC